MPSRQPDASSNPTDAPPITVIEPPRGWMAVDFKEIWRYRELFGFLVWRDIKVKYKQTLLGVSWAIIGPLASTIIFTLIFGKLAKLPSDGLPKPVFYMCGLVIWRYFNQAVSTTSNCLVGSQALLTKIYLPRLIIPTASVISSLVDFLIGFVILLVLMLYFGVFPSLSIFFIPLLVLMSMATALGIGLVFSALNVKYRDVRQIVPFILQLWMYCSVIVPFSEFVLWTKNNGYEQWKYLYGLNPMSGVIEGFRWSLAHTSMPPDGMTNPLPLILVGLPVSIVFLLFGLYYFKRVESQFADIV